MPYETRDMVLETAQMVRNARGYDSINISIKHTFLAILQYGSLAPPPALQAVRYICDLVDGPCPKLHNDR